MRRLIGIRTLKTAIGATVAIMLAELLGLQYSTAAGIITILSIQSTKKESLQIAGRRFLATIVAFTVAIVLFATLGYYPLVFGIYLLIFIPITAKFKLGDGIVMASVLVTHLLVEKNFKLDLLANELGLVLIGIGVGLFLNLYMPSIEGELLKERRKIEDLMYQLFVKMADGLEACAVSVEEEILFTTLKTSIQEAKRKAYKYSNNHFFATISPYEKYFEMRARQLAIMEDMRIHYQRLFLTTEETKIVSKFAREVAVSIQGKKTAKMLLQELESLRTAFKNSKLPTTREEFENRAMLYQYLNDMEQILKIKQSFREELTEEELVLYQKGYE